MCWPMQYAIPSSNHWFTYSKWNNDNSRGQHIGHSFSGLIQSSFIGALEEDIINVEFADLGSSLALGRSLSFSFLALCEDCLGAGDTTGQDVPTPQEYLLTNPKIGNPRECKIGCLLSRRKAEICVSDGSRLFILSCVSQIRIVQVTTQNRSHARQ